MKKTKQKKAKTKKTKKEDTVILSRKEVIKTIALFIGFCLLLNLILAGRHEGIRAFTASAVALLLRLFAFDVTTSGTLVTLNGFGMDVVSECTGIFPIILYSACVLAAPTNIKNKGIGILFGVPILYAISLIRLVSMGFVGIFYPSMLDWAHTYLWQILLIIFVVLLLLIWKDRLVK